VEKSVSSDRPEKSEDRAACPDAHRRGMEEKRDEKSRHSRSEIDGQSNRPAEKKLHHAAHNQKGNHIEPQMLRPSMEKHGA